MHAFALFVCLPWMLLLNFSLFQYLTTTYFHRRREMRVQLLIACAFLSFACLTVFAHEDEKVVRNLNSVSEVCSVLTFLLQITIICRDVCKRVKVRTLRWMTYAAETLVIFMVAIVVLNVVDICFPSHELVPIEQIDVVVQNVSLAFVFFFRFHYSSLSTKGGWRDMWTARKTEIVLYLLLVTHEYPFLILDHVSGLEWEYVEGLYMRALIISCLSLTLCDKIRSSRTRRASNDSVGAVAKARHSPILPQAPTRVHVDGLTSNVSTITPSRTSR